MFSHRYIESVVAGSAKHLEAGERIDVMASALVGEMKVRKSMAQAFAVSALTLGTVTAFSRPQKLYVLLTDRRLLFFKGHDGTGRMTDQLVAQIPREALATIGTRPKKIMLIVPTLIVELALAGSEKGLTLQFPKPLRDEGRQIAGVLTRA